MNQHSLYPYIVHGLPDPTVSTLSLPIGHGLFATLFEDTNGDGGISHTPVGPEDLKAAKLTPGQAHQLALQNLLKFANTDDRLSIQMLGNPGDEVNFLLYSDHPRASACLRLPDLYDQARELLATDELCACVPQSEALVILPKRDRTYREMLIAKLREIEADAAKPISFDLFDLVPGGIRPFIELN